MRAYIYIYVMLKMVLNLGSTCVIIVFTPVVSRYVDLPVVIL